MNKPFLLVFFAFVLGVFSNFQAQANYLVYEDPQGQVTVADIIAQQNNLFVERNDGSLGFTDSVWWLKIPIDNPSTRPSTKNILFTHGLTGQITAYYADGQSIDVQTSGYTIPIEQRSFRHAQPVFSYTLQPYENIDVFVRIENRFVTFLDYRLVNSEDLANQLENYSQTAIAVIAALCVLLIYNIFLFFATQARVYGYYVIYLACALLCMAGLFDKVSWVNPFNVGVLSYVAVFGAIMYASAFMFIGEMFKDKLTNKQQTVVKILAVFSLLHIPFVYLVSSEFVMQAYGSYGTGTVISLGLLYLTLSAYSRGHPLAIYIALGWGVFILFSAVFILSWAGILDVMFSRFIAYGVLVEGIIFSLVLSYRMRLSEAELAEKRMNLTLLEKESEAKSLFLATMSHELRTPLNGIIGLTDLSLKYSQEPQVQDNLSKILASAKHLNNLLNQVLDYSKMSAGKLRLEVTQFELESTLREVISQYHNEITSKGLKLTTHFAYDLPECVRGDAKHIVQALGNLLDNAIKFTHQGCITVHIDFETRDAQTIELRISITDTGIGIDGAHLAQVFKPLEQGSKAISRLHGGLGLGLAITKQIVDEMKGELSIESELDVGTKCIVKIPLSVDCARPDVAVLQPTTDKLNVNFTGNVLLVEDNLINQAVALGYLRQLGLNVTVANDGFQAIDEVKSGMFDLIFMDLHMPHMDGYTATEEILLINPNLPIIALTAASAETDRKRAEQAGMAGFLGKPIDEPQMIAMLKLHLPFAEVNETTPVGHCENSDVTEGSSDNEFTALYNAGLNIALLKEQVPDTEMIWQVLAIFVKQYSNLEHDLSATKPVEDIRSKLHELKGTSGNLRMLDLHTFVRHVYDEKDDDTMLSQLPQVVTKVGILIAAIKAHLSVQ